MDTIYADFNNQDEEHRIRLNVKKSVEGLALMVDRLQEGLIVWLADEEGRVRAKLHQRAGSWVGIPEWESWHELPFGVASGTAAKS